MVFFMEPKIINTGLLAHVDSGKTTTVEQLLYHSGAIKAPGRVDDGTAHTDWLAIEQERGISVKAASTVISHNQVQINIIDTPGHTDFAGEVERTLSVLDSAVLIISALEGIQSYTEILWKALDQLKIPAIIFINKIDRTGCDIPALLDQLRDNFSQSLLCLNTPDQAGTRQCKVLENAFSEEEISCVCELDEMLTEKYINGESITAGQINAVFPRLVQERKLFPVLFGSAALGQGIEPLLDAMTALLPRVEPAQEGEPQGVVYKIEHDKTMGKVAHIRLFDGVVKNRDAITIARPAQQPFTEKITQIRKIYGQKYQAVGILQGGDIAAVCGLSGAKTGDIIGDALRGIDYKMAVPLFSVQALASSEAQLPQLVAAMNELTDEDPGLDFYWNREERELVVKVMGMIQIEVLGYLLKERYNLDVTFTPPSVIYKETPMATGIGFESYTMPKPCWAVVKLQIDPLPRGAGYQYESIVKDRDIFGRYQNHIQTSVPETLKQGLYGWEVTDLKVTLIGGEHHILHTHPLDFFLATPIAVLRGLTDAQTQLLEPILKVNLTANEEFLGKVMGDILAMRGEFESPQIIQGKFNLEARLPVATSMEYPIKFASLTSGQGIIKFEFFGYKECPLELGATTKRRGINPLDRAKWILHRRSALK